nr:hypothetical protein Iba_chr07bCG0210 [Ipomoea batatas]
MQGKQYCVKRTTTTKDEKNSKSLSLQRGLLRRQIGGTVVRLPNSERPPAMGRWRCLKRDDVAKAQIPVWGVAAVPETGTARTSVAGRCAVFPYLQGEGMSDFDSHNVSTDDSTIREIEGYTDDRVGSSRATGNQVNKRPSTPPEINQEAGPSDQDGDSRVSLSLFFFHPYLFPGHHDLSRHCFP